MLLAALLACHTTERELAHLFDGPALWPVVLTSETDVDELGTLQVGYAVVALLDVVPGADAASDPVDGAQVTVVADGRPVAAEEDQPGLYVTPIDAAERLFVDDGEPVSVSAAFAGSAGRVSGHGVAPLALDVTLTPQVAGQPLTLPLPDGYESDYDQVFVVVYAQDGTRTYSTLPETPRDWLDALVGEDTPPQIDLPGDAFPDPGQLYAVAVFGVARDEDGLRISGDLRSALSGFSAGAAQLLPVWTAP